MISRVDREISRAGWADVDEWNERGAICLVDEVLDYWVIDVVVSRYLFAMPFVKAEDARGGWSGQKWLQSGR